jgi:hypothetical protein
VQIVIFLKMGLSFCKCNHLINQHEILRLLAENHATEYSKTLNPTDREKSVQALDEFTQFTETARNQHLKCPWHWTGYYFFSRVTVAIIEIGMGDDLRKQVEKEQVEGQQQVEKEQVEGQ